MLPVATNATRIAVSGRRGLPAAAGRHSAPLRPRRRSGAIRICGACLLFAQREQPTQSDIIGAQRLQLAGKPLLHDLHSA